jgi:hypothetical protein
MTTAAMREIEAEAVAFIVGQAIGLEMGCAPSDYIPDVHRRYGATTFLI